MPRRITKKVREAFAEFPNWRRSQNELRQLRQKVTFAVFASEDDLDKVTAFVDSIFSGAAADWRGRTWQLSATRMRSKRVFTTGPISWVFVSTCSPCVPCGTNGPPALQPAT